MFNFNSSIKKWLMDAIGKMPGYQVMLIAAYWFDKHVLNEADMSDIVAAINLVTTDDAQAEMALEATVDYCDFCLGEPPNNEIWE